MHKNALLISLLALTAIFPVQTEGSSASDSNRKSRSQVALRTQQKSSNKNKNADVKEGMSSSFKYSEPTGKNINTPVVSIVWQGAPNEEDKIKKIKEEMAKRQAYCCKKISFYDPDRNRGKGNRDGKKNEGKNGSLGT